MNYFSALFNLYANAFRYYRDGPNTEKVRLVLPNDTPTYREDAENLARAFYLRASALIDAEERLNAAQHLSFEFSLIAGMAVSSSTRIRHASWMGSAIIFTGAVVRGLIHQQYDACNFGRIHTSVEHINALQSACANPWLYGYSPREVIKHSLQAYHQSFLVDDSHPDGENTLALTTKRRTEQHYVNFQSRFIMWMKPFSVKTMAG